MPDKKYLTLTAVAAAALLILPATGAGAAGTVVLTKLGGKPQTFSGARLVLKSSKLFVTLPDKRELVFEESSCHNTEEIMECEPIGVSVRTKGAAHELNVTGGYGYFNLTKVPQPVETEPPFKLPRHGLFLKLQTDDGTSMTIRGTLDVGGATLTGN